MNKSAAITRRVKAKINHTLVYMDGPQVITLAGGRNSTWIGVAIDLDTVDYPFFCSQISSDLLQRYLDGHVDLRYLFLYSKYKEYMTFDYSKYNIDGVYLSSIIFKSEYLPDEGFFARDHTEVFSSKESSVRPSEISKDSYIVDIDGNWEFPEFASFSDKMSSVYSFLYSLDTVSKLDRKPLGTQLTRLEETFSAHPWQGGFSYVHFYNDLYLSIPKRDRLNVREIAYASPGNITLDGSQKIFANVETAIKFVRENFAESKKNYQDLHHFLSKNKLLSASRDTVRGSKIIQETVKNLVMPLSHSISLPEIDTIHYLCEENWIITSKIVLSYYRRLIELFQFYAEGRTK